jgi:hypothetical protein
MTLGMNSGQHPGLAVGVAADLAVPGGPCAAVRTVCSNTLPCGG